MVTIYKLQIKRDAIKGRELTLFDGENEMECVSQVQEAFPKRFFPKVSRMTSSKECNTSLLTGKSVVKRVDCSLHILLAFIRHRSLRVKFVRYKRNELKKLVNFCYAANFNSQSLTSLNSSFSFDKITLAL